MSLETNFSIKAKGDTALFHRFELVPEFELADNLLHLFTETIQIILQV